MLCGKDLVSSPDELIPLVSLRPQLAFEPGCLHYWELGDALALDREVDNTDAAAASRVQRGFHIEVEHYGFFKHYQPPT
jgi:hypothetical protein